MKKSSEYLKEGYKDIPQHNSYYSTDMLAVQLKQVNLCQRDHAKVALALASSQTSSKLKTLPHYASQALSGDE